MKEIFETNLTNRFEKLEEEVTARSFSEIIKEEANQFAGKTKEEAPVLSREDQEIKQLEDRRKELRKKEDRSQRERENRVYRAEQNGEKETQTKIPKETDRSC